MKKISICFILFFFAISANLFAETVDTVLIKKKNLTNSSGCTRPSRAPGSLSPNLSVTIDRDAKTLSFISLCQLEVGCLIRNEEDECLVSDYFVLTAGNPHMLNLYDLPSGVYTIILFLDDKEYYGEFRIY